MIVLPPFALLMEKNAKIYVAGHRGMVGSAIVRELERQGYTNIITRTHKELDLCRQDAVEEFFATEKPEYVFLAAAKVGGIVANQEALADFMYENMVLEMNVIHSAWKNGCKKLEFLGSSCIYPRMAPQPMKESCLLTSELEKTNEAYIVKNFEAATGMKVPYVIKDRRPGDIATCYCDPGKAAKELGWKAENGIKEMCEDSWRWQKNNPNGYEG